MTQDKLTVAVLFGGVSSEHEVSRMSVTSVIRNLDPRRYELILLGITKDGRWLRYTGPVEKIISGEWENCPQDCTPAVISPDASHHGILLLDSSNTVLHVDVVFPVLHGKNGEDGTVQGLFELAQIPYVGCGVLASADCMDKEVTHILLAKAGIPMAKFTVAHAAEMGDFDALEARVSGEVPYPIFVKPANAGSSVGVSRADDREGLRRALELAFQNDEKAVLEETLTGREVECAMMGNLTPIASRPGEIVPCNEFYDYEAKYLDDASELHIPARLSQEQEETLRRLAVSAYQAMGCRGLSRVDFFVTEKRGVVLNELNTLPGFTNISMYPKLMQHMGMSYSELLDKLIALALEEP